MTPEFKAEWLSDLRSGKYPKTRNHLKDEVGYCCLGVACETAKIGFPLDPNISTPGQKEWYPFAVDDQMVCTGNELSQFGLEYIGLTTKQHDRLVHLNDDSDTFDRVIEYIENEIETN